MTGQELIDIIKTNNLEDHEVVIKFMEPAPASAWGVTYRQFDVEGLGDIGHSDKVVIFGVSER